MNRGAKEEVDDVHISHGVMANEDVLQDLLKILKGQLLCPPIIH